MLQAWLSLLVPALAAGVPTQTYHQPAPYGHPAPYAAAPAYGGYHQPAYHQPAYGYEHPKHNCSVLDVVEAADVCTPALETNCAPVDLARKSVKDVEQCYDVTRTVCTESIEEIDNEVCSYTYQPKNEETTGKTVEVTFKKECETMMVTVCEPGHGYGGYGGYGHNYCKEVAQETCYNVPVVTPVEPAVTVAYPEPKKVCVNKPIDLPIITCEDVVSETCITVPEVEEGVAVVEKCVTVIAAPACSTVELTLPKQVCKEINYGVELETHDVEPYVPETPAPYHA